jgi:hypothetical protein
MGAMKGADAEMDDADSLSGAITGKSGNSLRQVADCSIVQSHNPYALFARSGHLVSGSAKRLKS